ncbi:MAG: hybrid sensor histidine kinase/response regulator, partial [Burkholderiales bacterium PBB5]
MSHELRTPLHGLLGMLSLLKDSPRDPSAGQWLGTADDSASHLLRLLDDILDLSKLESGTLTLSPAPVHLATLLREVQALMQPAASAKGLNLQAELDPSLPSHVRLDGTRVRQVLFNLLINAVKFSDSGVIVLRCRRHLGGGADGVRLEFDVADTGIGMDPQMVARLFRRFSRADDPRARQQGGTGLGLAISRNLARLMGGEIVVRSTPGAGSVFSFRCPLQQAEPALAGAEQSAPLVAPPTLRVLVAEDHPVNRLYMQALLDRLGHSVTLVDDGLAAVQAMRAQPFDLVLMDVHMPVMDGVAATAEIRNLPAPAGRTPIVALTADVFADTRARCLAAGAAEVLTKPLGLPALQSLLARRFGLS